ncbi:MAG: haloacid dehalogenase [Candidatus Acidoferrum typicum]|nr:haloacid dehalogenase [Candidatus Acidoferrum typicum]
MKTEGKRWKWTWWLLVVGVGLRFYFVQELIAVFAFFAIGFAVVAFAILILYVLQKGWEAAVAHFTNSEDSSEPGLQAGKPARKCRELEAIESHGLDVWAYRDTGWFVRDPNAPHVAREQWTVKFPPTVVKTFAGLLGSVAKIVGVSDDYDRVVKCEKDVQQAGVSLNGDLALQVLNAHSCDDFLSSRERREFVRRSGRCRQQKQSSKQEAISHR